jgi:hypothetical protein
MEVEITRDPLADFKYRILIVPGIGRLGLMSEINNGQHVCLKNLRHTDSGDEWNENGNSAPTETS